MTLVPHPVKREVFDQAKESAVLFGRLVHLVSQDSEYIEKVLKSVTDPFTARLKQILRTVVSEGVKQPLAMGIHRSDYMIHRGEQLQQVEINTISSAFGALTHRMPEFHSHLVTNWSRVVNGNLDESGTWQSPLLEKEPLENDSINRISSLFESAVEAYSVQRNIDRKNSKLAVLMIVQPGERNSVDQRWLQYAIEKKSKIRVIRHCLRYVALHAGEVSSTSDYVLTLDGYEICVAYYRAGYTPNDYPGEEEWKARLEIERSRAIKCPNIGYHLVGTKKMQQYLALPSQLERFLRSESEAKFLRNCFTGLYSLSVDDEIATSDSNTSSQVNQKEIVEEVIKKAISEPHRFVMKPQREGGGNLLAKEEMVNALKTMNEDERADYILMERIEPETHKTILFRDATFVNTACIAELGVYCLVLADSTKEVVNEYGGWLLRSKPADVEDGGVAAGRAFLDSPFLV